MASLVPKVTAPSISSPSLLTSQSRQSSASTSKPPLQATPNSSHVAGHVFSIGSVYKIGNTGVRRARGQAVYLSAGQGVVIVDPSTQSAHTSYTFPPSLQPLCAPLVMQSALKQMTYVCISSKMEGSTAEVYCWTQARGASSESTGGVTLQKCQIGSDVRSLHPLASGEVLAQHSDGTFSIIGSHEDGTLVAVSQTTLPNRAGTRWIHHISVLDRFASATIMKSSSKKPGIALIAQITSPMEDNATATRNGRKGRRSAAEVIDAAEGQSSTAPSSQMRGSGELLLELFLVDEGAKDAKVKPLSSLSLHNALQGKDAKEIKDVTLFHSGRLAICTASGQLITAILTVNAGNNIDLQPPHSIFFPLIAQNSSSLARLASLQLVNSSIALLVFAEVASDSITALLVDLNLSCVLYETVWKARGVETVHTSRIAGSNILVLATCQDPLSKVAISLWTVPYVVSEESQLRWALASSSLTRKWIKMDKTGATVDKGEAGRAQLIKELERISINKTGSEAEKAMDEAFRKWERKESSRVQEEWLITVGKEEAQEDQVDSSDSEGGKGTGKGSKGSAGRHAEKGTTSHSPIPTYPQSFLLRLLDLTLPAAPVEGDKAISHSVYAKQTISHLLTLRVVTNSLRARLLSSLMSVNDWDALLQAVSTVKDLPELDVVEVLLHFTRQSMIDQKDVRLNKFLQTFVSIALNRNQVRIALKSRLEKVEEVIVIVDVISNWLDKTQEAILDEFQLAGGGNKKHLQKSKLPKLDEILTLLCDMMDTYFPLFLSSTGTHQHLRRLSRQINGHLSVYNQLLILRGPLEAFSRLYNDREREAKLEAKASLIKDEDEKIMSLRRAQKKATQSKANPIGEVGGGLGKGVLGDKSRRRQLYEENVAVGLYSLERFEF
ncbi:hypothetical protein CBS101457_004196 [Exobasidium rhododendri]|nr:hypothetical protein CBS101457_004196 [Exobasidium rhododendri]